MQCKPRPTFRFCSGVWNSSSWGGVGGGGGGFFVLFFVVVFFCLDLFVIDWFACLLISTLFCCVLPFSFL